MGLKYFAPVLLFILLSVSHNPFITIVILIPYLVTEHLALHFCDNNLCLEAHTLSRSQQKEERKSINYCKAGSKITMIIT